MGQIWTLSDPAFVPENTGVLKDGATAQVFSKRLCLKIRVLDEGVQAM